MEMNGAYPMRLILFGVILICSSLASVAAELPINLRQGMDYDVGRKALLNSGWQTEPRSTRSPDMSMAEATMCGKSKEFSDRMCRKYPEYDGCGHVCNMYFIDAEGHRLGVSTDHNDHYADPRTKGRIKGWGLEK